MSQVVFDISMSLDGFIAGPNDRPGLGLGEGGERLHQWLYELASWRERHGLAGGQTNRDAELLDEAFRNTRASIVGRRMFDNAGEWGENPPFDFPVFVLTHQAREPLVKGGTTFTFVNDGIESALAQARAAAGAKNVAIGGGANVAQQYLRAGLIDEIEIHLVPILLGGGIRLFDRLGDTQFELERTRVIESPAVTHLRFRVIK
jgi:dihydrofolate reductase